MNLSININDRSRLKFLGGMSGKSFYWIASNPQATQKEIPKNLLEFWRTNVYNNEKFEASIDKQLEIFVYALSIYYTKYKKDDELKMPEEEIMNKFAIWQLILSTIGVELQTGIEFAQIKIFDFDNYDNLSLEVLNADHVRENLGYLKEMCK